MKSLQDALYNWLSIKVVCDARPDDKAASNTFDLFDKILKSDHHIEEVNYKKDEEMYVVEYQAKGEQNTMRFPLELINCMIDAIEDQPERFRNFDVE
ncbi:hypothetical protein [Bacillus sp. Marseille-P3661]|uniref:hypothetical protein n=1 Tax=Bacillus sp. Marseille-P3661 TaxID=1936234 RepID=UPI000C85E1BE|nr:hypothetical protein [Bacillus sp. Marseille-P3661]